MHTPSVPQHPISRRTLVTAAAAGLVASVATPSVATPSRANAAPARYRTVGRTAPAADGFVQFTWPGVYFEARFRGSGVGVVLDDAVNDYDVQIDGVTARTVVTPGRATVWVDGLADAVHRVRLVKRTESPWAVGKFGGFVAAPGGALLPGPRPRHRQIEFIGDSFTAGYGNVSGVRDCSGIGGVDRNTNADLSFAALTARALGADHQNNAFSGRGMVRNYAGTSPGTDYRTYYDRALLNVDGDVWHRPPTWRPQLIVVGLGINDFSTPLHPGEAWATEAELLAAYETAYHGFLDRLRARYGPRPHIVVSSTRVSTVPYRETVERITRTRSTQGDHRVHHWYYGDAALDLLACDWHPSLQDHRLLSGLLLDRVSTLRLRW
ncbi:SGNH/GDSL hydrolase family protein [Streptomyces roseirectus]|uniref:SGNH/GDSL hydrolase family protein n=1 Tax=Streptomyces roseirectus TaxID=2768066 RepID=A0A7H0IES5_9ACTN|nr:SGNH/GDSL hydrolase family protein [Streptomyces roseirectus]QNP71291.1 SGNH/GDSL hydrolase family protein [Streptomyces roseirectus]